MICGIKLISLRGIPDKYYQDAQIVIVMYDMTSATAAESLKHWMEYVRDHCPQYVAVFVVANKYDLKDAHQVDKADAEKTLQSVYDAYAAPMLIQTTSTMPQKEDSNEDKNVQSVGGVWAIVVMRSSLRYVADFPDKKHLILRPAKKKRCIIC